MAKAQKKEAREVAQTLFGVNSGGGKEYIQAAVDFFTGGTQYQDAVRAAVAESEMSGDKNMAMKLLALTAYGIDGKDKDGNTLMHQAANIDDWESVGRLIDARASVKKKNNVGNTVLHIAAEKSFDDTGVLGKAELYLDGEGSAKINTVVQKLIKAGADVDAQNKLDKTPLHLTSSSVVAAILAYNGADINIQDNHEQRALKSDDIEWRANTRRELAEAVSKGDTEQVKKLLKKHKELTSKIHKDDDPLLITAIKANAVTRVNPKMLQTLIELGAKIGADINEVDQKGNTALHAAARRGDLTTVTTLLEAGADASRKNNDNQTAFQLVYEGLFRLESTTKAIKNVLKTAEDVKQEAKAMERIASYATASDPAVSRIGLFALEALATEEGKDGQKARAEFAKLASGDSVVAEKARVVLATFATGGGLVAEEAQTMLDQAQSVVRQREAKQGLTITIEEVGSEAAQYSAVVESKRRIPRLAWEEKNEEQEAKSVGHRPTPTPTPIKATPKVPKVPGAPRVGGWMHD